MIPASRFARAIPTTLSAPRTLRIEVANLLNEWEATVITRFGSVTMYDRNGLIDAVTEYLHTHFVRRDPAGGCSGG